MRASWVYFRYQILDQYDELLPAREHPTLLESVRGKPAPYRKADPEPHDLNNYVMQLRSEQIRGEACEVFSVGHSIESRLERRYNRAEDRVEVRSVEADDMRLTTIIMVPRLGMIAVKDGSGDRLNAVSGAGRLGAVLKFNTKCDFKFERTSSHEDVVHAMESLQLEEFTFEVRPFNPHPSNPGQQLHEMLSRNGIGKLKAQALPSTGSAMNSEPEGLISEATGLSGRGYGQFGLTGRTPSGAQIKFKKPPMVGDTGKDIEQQEKPTALRVTVPVDEGEFSEYEHVVQTMRDLFEPAIRRVVIDQNE